MDELSPGERLMAEIAANMIAITESEIDRVVRPPSGPMSEVGHYHQLAKRKLRRRDLDALQQVLDGVAFDVAAMVLALLDGKLESDESLPTARLVDRDDRPIEAGLHELYLSIWDADDDQDAGD